MIARLTMTGLRGHGVLPFRHQPDTERQPHNQCVTLPKAVSLWARRPAAALKLGSPTTAAVLP